MISIRDGELYDILQTPLREDLDAQCYSYALKVGTQLVLEHADIIRTNAMIDIMPEPVIDILALQFRAQYYDQTLPLQTKREIVKRALRWHYHAGTPSTVSELINVVFGGGDIVEWPDFDEPPYTPGTFDIVTKAQLTPDMVDRFMRILQDVKGAGDHLRRVLVLREIFATWYVGAGFVSEFRGNILNHRTLSLSLERTAYAAAAMFARGGHTVDNNAAPRFRELKRIEYAAAAAIGRPGHTVDNNVPPRETAARSPAKAAAAMRGRPHVAAVNLGYELQTQARPDARAAVGLRGAPHVAAANCGYSKGAQITTPRGYSAAARAYAAQAVPPSQSTLSAAAEGALFCAVGLRAHAHATIR